MKQTEEMKTYIGNVRKRISSEYDEEFYKTYESELTLSEKNNRKRQHGPNSSKNENISKPKTKEGSNISTYFWLIGLVAASAFYINSKAGKENIKRVITDCGRPSPIRFGSIIVDDQEGTKYGSKASVVCSEGYSSSKPETICRSNGKWSSVYCHVTDCGKSLPVVENGRLTLNKEQDSIYNAMAIVTCAPGYQRSKKSVTCEEDGRWGGAVCEPVDCGKPDTEHGKLEFVKTTYMSEASVKCETGYAPSQPNIKCTATGLWLDAHCYNIDDCSPNPCLNKGVCVDKVADFSCQCPQWFSGKTCQIDNQPCRNHQCRNGGTCINNPDGSYKCKCPAHIDGNFCERPH